MNDCHTLCRACNRASNGEEYCARCESDIAKRERADDERGFSLPVKAESGCDGSWVEDCGAAIVSVNALMVKNHRELAEVIADAINAYYSDETEGA